MKLFTNNDERFLSFAIDEANKSELRAKIGCIAVVSGKIVARGYNTYQTHSKDGLIHHVCSCHAEVSVLRKCLKQNIRGKINLYIIRVTNNGDLACSAPCLQCTKIMKKFNIKFITYIAKNGDTVKERFHEYDTCYRTSGEVALINNRVKCF
tara:strand:- start:2699 stop:3154 length:456 start_codon:yes stop_codon:yes gene_type:complete